MKKNHSVVNLEPLVAGVIGNPIRQSKSPIIHSYWLKKHSINGYYIPLNLNKRNIKPLLKLVRTGVIQGFNVTVPFKQEILSHVDEKSDAAKLIGAANIIYRSETGKIMADNSDCFGFCQALIQNYSQYSFSNETVLIYGAGGAAYAIVYAYLSAKVKKIKVINRTRDNAEKLSHHFNNQVETYDWSENEIALKNVTTIVNTTSLGMLNATDFYLSLDKGFNVKLAIDLIYNPLETSFLKQARQSNIDTMNGLDMLIHQAIPGFNYWYGLTPESDSTLLKTIKSHL